MWCSSCLVLSYRDVQYLQHWTGSSASTRVAHISCSVIVCQSSSRRRVRRPCVYSLIVGINCGSLFLYPLRNEIFRVRLSKQGVVNVEDLFSELLFGRGIFSIASYEGAS